MLFGVTAFAERFAFGVPIFPRLAVRRITFVMDLQHDTVCTRSKTAYAPPAIQLDDLFAESNPFRMAVEVNRTYSVAVRRLHPNTIIRITAFNIKANFLKGRDKIEENLSVSWAKKDSSRTRS